MGGSEDLSETWMGWERCSEQQHGYVPSSITKWGGPLRPSNDFAGSQDSLRVTERRERGEAAQEDCRGSYHIAMDHMDGHASHFFSGAHCSAQTFLPSFLPSGVLLLPCLSLALHEEEYVP